MRYKSVCLLSAAIAAIATPALAQDMPAAPQPGGPPAAAPATAADTIMGNDIVITATRRSERLSDVPIAVSAIAGEALTNTGATDIRQMTQLAPSLLVSSTGSEANASARIRGIGTVGDNPGLESSVAVFIDGVYRSRTGSGLNDLGEVDRIEVLRGPQGTLFGRNASAGLINILTKQPSFTFGGYGEGSYGNYNAWRLAGGITGPLTDTLAFRLDGVVSKRDGFYRDVVNNTDYNNRNRYFIRGQMLFEPSDAFSFRLIGDYTYRNEKCCGAVYINTDEKIDPTPGVPGDYALAASNRIVDVMKSMGAIFPSAGDPYDRQIANTPGRAYSNVTRDWGVSGQFDVKFGDVNLTSITAYRYYKAFGAADIDYGNLDIGYRPDDGNAYRQFKTFSQELRLNGTTFGGKLDWLVGGYYSHEDLTVADNLKFGTQYGAFAACRIVATINPAAALRNPNASGCLSAAGRPIVIGALTAAQAPLGLAPGVAAANANRIVAGLDTLSTLNNLGDQLSLFKQTSENYAFFTHNIFKLTDTLSLTAGVRYTHEKKTVTGSFSNNNSVCPAQQGALGGLLTNAALVSLAGGIITLSCTGNSSTSLNALALHDSISEGEFTGTGVLSYKPISDLMLYASYSRGYKAGGYNLDRSDLTANAFTIPTNASVTRLRFDPERVNSYEIGAKLSLRQFSLNVAAFRQEFQNFQLNTFNGTNYVVQNIGSCDTSLNGADTDNSAATGVCTGKVKYGVLSQGVEVEAGIYPSRTVAVTIGYTLADTRYRHNLVGSEAGEALDNALFLLAGSQMSNAPRNTISASATWTPEIGHDGMTGLLYADTRVTSDYNTGSDLFAEKEQDGFVLVNARIGLRGKDQKWAIEFWGQNLLNTNYTQVSFNAPFQGSGSVSQVKAFGGTGNQIFEAFLAEPRTYGLTLRTRF